MTTAAEKRDPPPIGEDPPADRSMERAIDSATTSADPGAELRAGTLVHGRYEVLRPLGRGAQGEVWTVLDSLSGAEVALKLFRAASRIEAARVRREIAALHLLRVPGVVRLLDEGLYLGEPFVVMEHIEGSPFPGRPLPAAWSEIAHATTALLETLRSVHASGVIHRDLKPSNILVDTSGRPVVLDFGLALGAPIGVGLTSSGILVGTPAYLAPEQILGGQSGPEADLYAVGAMLYEALSGHPPHHPGPGGDVETLLHGRLTRPAVPLERSAPDAPPAVIQIVTRLLAPKPADRPASAGEVLRMLRETGETGGIAAPPGVLSILGERPATVALVSASRAGRAHDVIGPHGSGKTNCLRRAREQLVALGHRVVELRPGIRPFDSLAPLSLAAGIGRSAGLDTFTAAIEKELRELLSAGVVVVCDDAERLDPWSAELLQRCGASGAVLRAFALDPRARREDHEGATALHPFTVTELERLFVGQNRLFHLREDAAACLWERTAGHAARIVEEVSVWLRGGVARREGEHLAIDRDTLDRLRAGGRAREVRAETGQESAEVTGAARELLTWVSVAWPDSTLEVLSTAMDEALWRVEAEMTTLVRLGHVRLLPDERAEPLVPLRGPASWAPEKRRAAHRTIAAVLPPSARGRFLHLALGMGPESSDQESRDLADEGRARAHALALEGNLGEAIATLDETLRVIRAHPRPGLGNAEGLLLSLWAEIALESSTPHALDRVLYEISRCDPQTAFLQEVERLLRAGIDALDGPAAPALERIQAVAPFSNVDLARRHRALLSLVARRCPPARHEEILNELLTHASAATDPESSAGAHNFRGRWYYRTARFAEAAAEHFAAAAATRWTTTRIAEMLFAASASMEAFDLENAARAAAIAKTLSARCRNPYFEARSEWMTRCIDYRRGLPLRPDTELMEAISHLGVPDLEALVYLQEGTIAWRSGGADLAIEACGHARRIWTTIGKPWGVLLARSVMLAAGAETGPGELEEILEKALTCPIPGVGVQVLALTAPREAPPPQLQGAARALAAQISKPDWHHRLDVMSVEEALVRAGVSEPRHVDIMFSDPRGWSSRRRNE